MKQKIKLLKKLPFTYSLLIRNRVIGAFIGLLPVFIICGFTNVPFTLSSETDIRAQLKLPSGPFKIGDKIPILLTIETKKNVTYQLPDFVTGDLNGLEQNEKKIRKTEEFPRGTRKSIQYILTGWQTGKYSLPVVKIDYQTPAGEKNSYQLPELTIEISSVLPKDKTENELAALEVKPLKKPLGLPPDYRLLLYCLIGVIFVGLITFGLVRLIAKTSGTGTKITVKEPSDIIALKRLTFLKNSDYLQQGDFKTYFSELSDCIREYMENRFLTKALEMTTEEFLAYLTTVKLVNQEHRLMLKQILSTADLVKFAKQNPPVSEANAALTSVEQFITTTKETVDLSDENGSNEEKTDDLS